MSPNLSLVPGLGQSPKPEAERLARRRRHAPAVSRDEAVRPPARSSGPPRPPSAPSGALLAQVRRATPRLGVGALAHAAVVPAVLAVLSGSLVALDLRTLVLWIILRVLSLLPTGYLEDRRKYWPRPAGGATGRGRPHVAGAQTHTRPRENG